MNFARDKGRARMSLILIFLTVVGCFSTVFLAKYHKSTGKSSYSEDLMNQHAQYSKMHRDQMRITQKND